MTNLTKRQVPHRSKINTHQPGEARYWANQLGISQEQLRKLVEKVGNSAAAVRKQLEMPKENDLKNDLEGAQDQGGKHGGQTGIPKPTPRPARQSKTGRRQ